MVIKYIGSKRTLIPQLSELASCFQPTSATDLFTGTTRVAQAYKKLGITTTATDLAHYSHVFAKTYIATDRNTIDLPELANIVTELNALPGVDGFFTENFARRARFLQPHNAKRVDAIRERIERDYGSSPYREILLTSLIEAADRVDSTTGVQMAYLKQWAARSANEMQLRVPDLLPGPGRALRGNAMDLITQLPPTDLLYLDPPYNQHRYDANYHMWQSLVIWDKQEGYGIANKRIDLRDDESLKSTFNKKGEIALSMGKLIQDARATTIMVSFNNEGWVSAAQIHEMLGVRDQPILRLDFDFKRYVGAQIGIHNPQGEKVGQVKATRNIEHLFVCSADATGMAQVRERYAPYLNVAA